MAGVILLAILAFVAIAFLHEIIVPDALTYYLIQLVFALVCGLTGAIIGGSAAVRSAFNIQGSPVRASLGGAVAMIPIGFAIARYGTPPPQAAVYSLDIHNLPHTYRIGNDAYTVKLSAFLPLKAEEFPQGAGRRYRINIPAQGDRYQALIQIYRVNGDDLQFVSGCELRFETLENSVIRGKFGALFADRHEPHFNLDFREAYIGDAVEAAKKKRSRLGKSPCLEGMLTTSKEPVGLDGTFLVSSQNLYDRFGQRTGISLGPSHMIKASQISAVDISDAEENVPPSGPETTPPIITSDVAKPSPPPILPPAAETQNSAYSLVDRYIKGEEFDRAPIYASWNEIKGYVTEGFRTEYAKRSPFAARYLHLISNALNEIDGRKFVPPLRNPSFGGKVKPDRLSPKNSIPGFEDADYAKVVDLLAEKDDVLTKAAQRLIRLFPSNRFYKPLQAYWQKTTMSDEELSQMAEAAVYYYFNRIVEYQGSFPLDEQSRGWVKGNYDNGQAWVDRAAAKDNSNRLLGAMLDYARGAVLWDRKEEEAGMYFRRMLDVIRTSDESYPFNPQHIATALAVVNDPGQVTKVPASSRPYNAGERRKLSAKVFQSEAGQIKLYALPHIQSKELAKVGADASARMILHAEGWDLLRVGAQLGWAQRTAPTIATADAVH